MAGGNFLSFVHSNKLYMKIQDTLMVYSSSHFYRKTQISFEDISHSLHFMNTDLTFDRAQSLSFKVGRMMPAISLGYIYHQRIVLEKVTKANKK